MSGKESGLKRTRVSYIYSGFALLVKIVVMIRKYRVYTTFGAVAFVTTIRLT